MPLVMQKHEMPEQDANVRRNNFDEVALGYTEELALAEVNRCLHCKVPHCRKGCPVDIDIPAFIAKIKEGDFEGANAKIKEASSLPAICGRVCPQENQCEKYCVMGIKGEPVGIGRLERFVADYCMQNCKEKIEKTVKDDAQKVAIIGSGPAGLACAGDLAKKGYQVTIFEALHTAGGVLSYGIPEFRLPKDKVVKPEIDNLRKMGVKIEVNSVVGGGNVAMDSARTALRLGAEKVYIVYRRSEKELPARCEEVEHAKQEGIEFKLLNNPVAILGDEKGYVKAIRCIKMELGEPDASGRRRPVEILNSEFDINVDTVVIAIGQGPNPLIQSTTPDMQTNKRGNIIADEETGKNYKRRCLCWWRYCNRSCNCYFGYGCR